MPNYVCDYIDGPDYKTFTGSGPHLPGNKYSVPALVSCFGLICVPQFLGGQWFMAHSKDPGSRSIQEAFHTYWTNNHYGTRNDFSIIYKSATTNNLLVEQSIALYFSTKKRPPPIRPQFQGYRAYNTGNLGEGGMLALFTNDENFHMIYGFLPTPADIRDVENEHIGDRDFHVCETYGVRKTKEKWGAFKFSEQELREFKYTKKFPANYAKGQVKRKTNKICEICKVKFGGVLVFPRQHRCRNCNAIICSKCSVDYELPPHDRICRWCIEAEKTKFVWPTRVLTNAAPPPPPLGRASFGINPGFNLGES
jgi:hypothetical protein